MATPEQTGPHDGTNLGTPNYNWKLLRANATEDATAKYTLTSDDLSFETIIKDRNTAIATDGIFDLRQFGKAANSVEIAFFSDKTDIANDTFDFELYMWRGGQYGGAKSVYRTASAANKIGSMVCVNHPTTGAVQANGLWCDTISGTSSWFETVGIADSATNEIAILHFDALGWRFLQIRIFNADGTSLECGRIGAVISAR